MSLTKAYVSNICPAIQSLLIKFCYAFANKMKQSNVQSLFLASICLCIQMRIAKLYHYIRTKHSGQFCYSRCSCHLQLILSTIGIVYICACILHKRSYVVKQYFPHLCFKSFNHDSLTLAAQSTVPDGNVANQLMHFYCVCLSVFTLAVYRIRVIMRAMVIHSHQWCSTYVHLNEAVLLSANACISN